MGFGEGLQQAVNPLQVDLFVYKGIDNGSSISMKDYEIKMLADRKTACGAMYRSAEEGLIVLIYNQLVNWFKRWCFDYMLGLIVLSQWNWGTKYVHRAVIFRRSFENVGFL